MPEVDERAHQGPEHRVGGDAVDQAAVELDDVRGGHHDVAQRREPGAHVVDRETHAARPQRREGGAQGVVVVDRVVLGELEQDPLQRQPVEQRRALRRQQRRGGHVHRHVAVDRREVVRGALQREQLELVPEPDAVGLAEADVGRLAPVLREAAEGLGPDPVTGRQLDDRLQDDERAAGLHHRQQPLGDLVAARLLADARLDDQRGGMCQHLHQRAVALGERGVGREAGGAERAVERAVAEHHRHRDVAADPRQPGGRQLHRGRELLDVRDHRGQPAVQDRLAEGRLLLLGGALLEQERHRRLHHLEVLGGPVQPGQERDRQVEAALGRTQEVGDLLLGGGPLPSSHGQLLDR